MKKFQSRYQCSHPRRGATQTNTLIYFQFSDKESFTQKGLPENVVYLKNGPSRVYPNPSITYYSLNPNEGQNSASVSSGDTIRMRDQYEKEYQITIEFIFENPPASSRIVESSLRQLLDNLVIYFGPNNVRLFLV